MRKIPLILLALAFSLALVGNVLSAVDFPIRIIGNKAVDYEDVNGDLWFAAQTQYDAATGADG